MHRKFPSLTMMLMLKRCCLWIAFVLLLATPVVASDFAVQGGLGISTQVPMLFGYAVSFNLRGESQGQSWFTDTQLVYHQLNSVTDAESGNAKASISFRSLELNWFLLLNVANRSSSFFFWGPGIGYGIAEIDENVSYEGNGVEKDPSYFFTANDIHYGTLLLKLGYSWNNKTCEGRLSSFGGLIGGTLLCGIFF
ncbi:MAG: hypothetical protein ABIK68_06435 [bacterium]